MIGFIFTSNQVITHKLAIFVFHLLVWVIGILLKLIKTYVLDRVVWSLITLTCFFAESYFSLKWLFRNYCNVRGTVWSFQTTLIVIHRTLILNFWYSIFLIIFGIFGINFHKMSFLKLLRMLLLTQRLYILNLIQFLFLIWIWLFYFRFRFVHFLYVFLDFWHL